MVKKGRYIARIRREQEGEVQKGRHVALGYVTDTSEGLYIALRIGPKNELLEIDISYGERAVYSVGGSA
jgi:hypothetical protein